MKRDPSTDMIYYMTNKADIYQLIIKPGNASGKDKPYTLAKIGGNPDLIASGMAFGPDGTLYVMGNVNADNTAHGVCVQRQARCRRQTRLDDAGIDCAV